MDDKRKNPTESDTPLGPAVPVPDDSQDLREACDGDRSAMEPRRTADCAGLGLVEAYENEEDGGS
ncbi:MAG: hypothetical protein KJ747_07880 [Actinobacteria bacterium]|nr:hypothetical protein [Actinomycetota bacterium]MCG2808311.1 hypothetical protein [Coriobacteriia bacterium]